MLRAERLGRYADRLFLELNPYEIGAAMTKKQKYPPCPENFVPCKQKAIKAGMTEYTYEVEAEDFKNRYCGRENTGNIFDWDRTWSRWIRAWVVGTYRPSPKFQYTPPAEKNQGFTLTRETKKQNEAWVDYYSDKTNPEKSLFAAQQIRRILEGWSETWFVASEYPPTKNNVVQFEQYRLVV